MSAVTGSLGLLALTAGTARADTTSGLPELTSFHQMAVDAAAGYVFLSEGQGSASSSGIVVTDLSGNYVTTLDSGDASGGLALSSDGRTLYAALGSSGAVAAIDVSSGITAPAQTQYPLPSGDVPYGVALENGYLWVSYNAAAAGTSAIGDLDVSDASPSFETQPAMGGWYSAPDIAADPASGGTTLVAMQPGISPSAVAVYDVSEDPATLTGSTSGLSSCDTEEGLTVLPGGSQFLVACPGLGGRYFNTGNLSLAGSYEGGEAAVSADASTGLVAVGNTVQSEPDVYVYQPGSGTAANEFAFSGGATLAPGGLALAAGGTALYALTQMAGSADYSLQVFDSPALNTSTLKLTGPAKAVVGSAVTLSGTLSLRNGAAVPSGTTVTVTRTISGKTTALPPATVSDGSFSFTDTLPDAAGSYTYSVSYTGDSGTASSTASATVTAALNTASLALTAPGTVTYGDNVPLTGKLSFGNGVAVPSGAAITITRTASGKSAETLHATTGSGESFSLTDKAPAEAKYTYTAVYAGNVTTAAAKATATVTVARTTPSLSVTTSAADYVYGTKITVNATLGSTFADRTVSIYATPTGASKKLVKTAAVNAKGVLSVTYTLTRNTVFTASFGGDVHNAPKTVTKTVGAEVKIATSYSGYYTTKTIDGTTYRVYHSTGHLVASVTVTPNKHGQCIDLAVQQYESSAGWFTNATFGCYDLNSSSKLSTYLTLTKAAGAQYRLRADYVRSSKDTTNVNTDSGWFYFEVTK
ncbi:MAG: hypothetical protein ACRDN0_16655 [Trebonia sp.]